jgi:hypothetical protein
MAEEKISTRPFGDIDAYLVEARSIGGLSGSPVFLNLGIARMIKNQLKFASGKPIFYLLGLIHGHYDIQTSVVDGASMEDTEDHLSPDRVNTAIAMVVPFHNIDAVIATFEARSVSS